MKKRISLLAAFAGLGVLTAILARAGHEQAAARHDASPEKPVLGEHAAAAPPSRSVASAPLRPSSVGAAGSAGGNGDIIGSTDPTSKGYDPITLMQVMNITPSEIMNKEQRDPAFAGPREAALQARIMERLRKRVTFEAKVDVACRTSSCEVNVQSANGTGDLDAALQALDLDMLAEAMQLGPMSGQKGVNITLLYSSELRDQAVYEQWLRRHQENDERPPKAP
jgi:hypothetical protein